MKLYEIEKVPIPIPQKPKGKWDDFIETFKRLKPWSDESFFVPLGDYKTIKILREQTTKELNKAGQKALAHKETHCLHGLGLRFWSKSNKKSNRGEKRIFSEEAKKRMSEAQKIRRNNIMSKNKGEK